MSIATQPPSEPRWARDLRSPTTLADDLGVLGAWVGPRNGPMKRTQGQKEDYLLRRLLVAWKECGRLSLPVQVRAELDTPYQPDFLLSWPDGSSLGIEVTEAGEENYQKWLTTTDDLRGKGAVDQPFDVSTSHAVEAIKRAIGDKVEKFDRGSYCEPASCDLLVYDNTSSGGFLDKGDLLNLLGRPNNLIGRFRQVHVIFGESIYLDIFGAEFLPVDVSKTYEIDYARWVFEQVERLRQGEMSDLDLSHIAEELEDLGRSERRAIASHLKNLMVHLLKWQFQPDQRSPSWRHSVDNARSEIHELLSESPSLRHEFEARGSQQYSRARTAAAKETDLSLNTFPEVCPYTDEQLVDPEYYPDQDSPSEEPANE